MARRVESELAEHPERRIEIVVRALVRALVARQPGDSRAHRGCDDEDHRFGVLLPRRQALEDALCLSVVDHEEYAVEPVPAGGAPPWKGADPASTAGARGRRIAATPRPTRAMAPITPTIRNGTRPASAAHRIRNNAPSRTS